MERRYTIVILIIAILALAFSIFTTDNVLTQKLNLNAKAVDKELHNTYYRVTDGYYISRHGKISIDNWNKIDDADSGFRNAKDFLTDVDAYVGLISEFIKLPDWEDKHIEQYREDFKFEPIIEFNTSDKINVASYTSYNMNLRATLIKDDFENNFSTLVRDITKIIARDSVADSLTEGLAFYVQDELGSNVTKLNYGIDIFAVSREYIKKDYEDVMSRIGVSYGNLTRNKKEAFYILSNSFCRYLIQNFGMEKFMEVYNSELVEPAYIKVFGVSLDELKASWIDYINNYDSYMKLSKDYLIDENKKVIKSIGKENDLDDIGGSIKNKAFFILDKSFKEYLISQFGKSNYEFLVSSNYDYQSVYQTSLTELKNLWQQYVKGLE